VISNPQYGVSARTVVKNEILFLLLGYKPVQGGGLVASKSLAGRKLKPSARAFNPATCHVT